MAIDVCSEISSAAAIISPARISFSHDLNQTDDAAASDIQDHQRRLDSTLLDSASNFDFSIGNITFSQELSSADELFSNGKILPIQIKQQTHRPEPAVPAPSRPLQTQTGNESCTEKKRLKEFLSMSLDGDDDDDHDEKPNSSSKSFWQFKRSSSLNSVSTSSKNLIRSLQFLTRSNSTGSAPNPNPKSTVSPTPKESSQKKNNLKRQPSVSRKSSGTYTYYSYCNNNTATSTHVQKPPLKKNCGGYHNANGVRISPVLNIPPPYISNATVSLFGFGSIFCNGKLRKKKR